MWLCYAILFYTVDLMYLISILGRCRFDCGYTV
jgi:hypothetical protein